MPHVVACLGSNLADTVSLKSSLQSIGLEFVCVDSQDELNALLPVHTVIAIMVPFPDHRALLGDFYKEIELGKFKGIQRILTASSSKEIMLARSMGYISDEYLI
jgi:hypothetical protein